MGGTRKAETRVPFPLPIRTQVQLWPSQNSHTYPHAEPWGNAPCTQMTGSVIQDQNDGFLSASSETFVRDHGDLQTIFPSRARL